MFFHKSNLVHAAETKLCARHMVLFSFFLAQCLSQPKKITEEQVEDHLQDHFHTAFRTMNRKTTRV